MLDPYKFQIDNFEDASSVTEGTQTRYVARSSYGDLTASDSGYNLKLADNLSPNLIGQDADEFDVVLSMYLIMILSVTVQLTRLKKKLYLSLEFRPYLSSINMANKVLRLRILMVGLINLAGTILLVGIQMRPYSIPTPA